MKKVISSMIIAYLLTGARLAAYFFAFPSAFPWYLADAVSKYADWLNILLKIFQPMILWGPLVIKDLSRSAGKLPMLLDCGLVLLYVMLALLMIFKVNRKGKKAIKAIEKDM